MLEAVIKALSEAKCHMKHYRKLTEGSVLVLLASGFEEEQIVHYTTYMRKNDVPASLIGLSPQQVSGTHGLSFQPDYSLNQLPCQETYPLVLMLGGYDYLACLMADPRVHQLIDDTFAGEGYVAAAETVEAIIPYTNAKTLLQEQRFITQKNRSHDEFAQYLVGLVRKVPLPV